MRSSITVGNHEAAIDVGDYETFDDEGNEVIRATGNATWWCSCGARGAGQNRDVVRALREHLGVDENGEASDRGE